MRGVPILCWHHKDNKLRSIYRCIKSHDSLDARLVLSHLLSLLFMQPYFGRFNVARTIDTQPALYRNLSTPH